MLSDDILTELSDDAYEYFKIEFEKLTGIQLSLYKEKQMKRRINTLIERKGLSDYQQFLKLIQTNAAELAYFVDYITINVTEFFRTLDHWKCFEEDVIGQLMNKNTGKIRVWSSACSTGEEAYSLAMSFLKASDKLDFEIIATDIDETVLKKAREGIYDSRSFETVPEEMQHYFVKHGLNWVVSDLVKQHVFFRKLDLLKDEYPKDCDVIVCRNVLIYFTEEGKKKIYELFWESMKTNSYLFTGNTEQLIYYKAYGFKKIKNYLYCKE